MSLSPANEAHLERYVKRLVREHGMSEREARQALMREALRFKEGIADSIDDADALD